MDAPVDSLGKTERDLLREAEGERLAALDEDGLIKLHQRVRKARNKYVGVYRRAGAKKVAKKGARGQAKLANSRNAARAEAFEDALARVSARLGELAAAAAAQLRADRLAAAQKSSTGPGAEASDADLAHAGAQVADRRPKGAGKTKRVATSQAAGARRQAKKDAR